MNDLPYKSDPDERLYSSRTTDEGPQMVAVLCEAQANIQNALRDINALKLGLAAAQLEQAAVKLRLVEHWRDDQLSYDHPS